MILRLRVLRRAIVMRRGVREPTTMWVCTWHRHWWRWGYVHGLSGGEDSGLRKLKVVAPAIFRWRHHGRLDVYVIETIAWMRRGVYRSRSWIGPTIGLWVQWRRPKRWWNTAIAVNDTMVMCAGSVWDMMVRTYKGLRVWKRRSMTIVKMRGLRLGHRRRAFNSRSNVNRCAMTRWRWGCNTNWGYHRRMTACRLWCCIGAGLLVLVRNPWRYRLLCSWDWRPIEPRLVGIDPVWSSRRPWLNLNLAKKKKD